MIYSLGPNGLQHARLPCPSPSPWVQTNSSPLSWWCYLTISSSAGLFSFCRQFFPASESFPMSRLFTSGGQNIGASASVLQMNIQDLFPLGLTDFISLLPKELPRVLSSTTIQKHHFIFFPVLSLLYGPTLTSIHDYWKNHSFDYTDLCEQSSFLAF